MKRGGQTLPLMLAIVRLLVTLVRIVLAGSGTENKIIALVGMNG